MNIFENLENLEVSEACFNDIMDIVEEIINEVSDDTAKGPWRKKKARTDELREKALCGTEQDRVKHENALLDELKHRAKYDSWAKGKSERMKKYKEQRAKEEQENGKDDK